MRHKVKQKKFSRPLGQRKALRKSLLKALIINERVKTTTAKAKFIKPEFDKLVALAKKDTLAARRQAFDKIGDHLLVKKLFNDIGPRFRDTKGSCCRIYKLGIRSGDGALFSLIEWTKKSPKKAEQKPGKVKAKKETSAAGEKPKQDSSKEKGAAGFKKIFKKRKKH